MSSQTYTVRHLHTDKTHTREWLLCNPHQKSFEQTKTIDPAVEAFHRTLPDYNETTLHSLPDLAAELGLSHVLLKDESTRFGLPTFKILGASWAIHRALCKRLRLALSSSIDDVCQAAAKDGTIRLVTCSEGNWGRACARTAKILGLAATIYVPGFMSAATQDLLRGEGADVRVLEGGTYDDSIAATRQDADTTSALMVMDTSFDDYTEIPAWVTQGYTTMLTETDRQAMALLGSMPNTFFVSIGVGSWAHSVVEHYKAADENNEIIAVEPDTAACVKESLHEGQSTAIETGETIMAGMNCGTPSALAWPVLRDGLHAAVTVTDQEAHREVEFLKEHNINAGPCGAATLAALRKYVMTLDENHRKGMKVVLFSTEGWRQYEVPAAEASGLRGSGGDE